MSEIEQLKARVDRLESRHAIADLVTAYAIACDEHDMPRLTGLFTADACFDSPSGAMVADGRDAIEAMFIELFKVRGPAFHWTHDHSVSFDDDDPDRASGLVLRHAETCPSEVVHTAFGVGPHRCIGEHLARLEIRIAVQEFLRRIPEFELDPARPPQFESGQLRTMKHMHLRWSV